MPKPILIWDFDGVMADSTDFVFAYWRQAFATHGIEFKLEDYQKTFTYKFPFDYLHEIYGSEIVTQIYQDYSAHEEQQYPDHVEAFPGFIKSFNQIATQYDHHIVSSNLASVIHPWLKKTGLNPHFAFVIGREVPGYKDEKITQLLDQLNRLQSDVQFIGDTISDIEHAHKAGVKAIGVSWGVHNHQQLLSAQPDAIYDTIPALFNYLRTT